MSPREIRGKEGRIFWAMDNEQLGSLSQREQKQSVQTAPTISHEYLPLLSREFQKFYGPVTNHYGSHTLPLSESECFLQ